MISHKDCSHPSTPGARAKCRRARQAGRETQEGDHTQSEGPRSPTSDTSRERNRGTTPRDRDKQCDICGVEKIAYRGTDPLNGIVLSVGERCEYYVRHAKDLIALP